MSESNLNPSESGPAGTKTAGGLTVYLMEELGDARLRCEQLKRYVAEAAKIINESTHRDHFFEEAGNLIYGIPQTLFKLDKALDAVAMAASRLDYEELKQELKPEKAEELEQVMKDVRLRSVQRRSDPSQLFQPKQANMFKAASKDHIAGALDRLAAFVETFPHPREVSARVHRVLMALSQTAEQAIQAVGYQQAGSREEVIKGFKSANPDLSEEQLNEIADQWEKNKDVVKDKAASTQTLKTFKAAAPTHVASALRRVAEGVKTAQLSPKEATLRLHRILMALSQTADQALQAMGPIQANSREEVMKGFKSANPDLSDAQLNEIADQWEKNKDVVKDKSADTVVARFKAKGGSQGPFDQAAGRAAAVKTKADFTKLLHQMSADLDTFEMAWGRYDRDPEANKHKLDDALKYMKDLRDLADVLIRNMNELKAR